MKTMNRLQSLAIGLGGVNLSEPIGHAAAAALVSQIIHETTRAASEVDDLERICCHLFAADATEGEVLPPAFRCQTDAEYFHISWCRAKRRLQDEFDLALYPQPKTN